MTAWPRDNNITVGWVYRAIPNWTGYFNYTTNRPQRRAFEPRGKDLGKLSVFPTEESARSYLKGPFADFGLCRLDASRVIGVSVAVTGTIVRIKQTSAAHAHMAPCTDDILHQRLTEIAEVLVSPKQKLA